LAEDYASYLYLQRLRDPEVLAAAIREGIASTTWRTETFAFAESFDEKTGRYMGLRTGKIVAVYADAPGLLVKAEVAHKQEAEDAAANPPSVPPASPTGNSSVPSSAKPPAVSGVPGQPAASGGEKPNHFFGNVQVDSARISRDVDALAKEVIQHLASLPGSVVKVTVEIQATVPAGVPDSTVRTVNENCRTLKFTNHGFERE
jgi:hypothetical protein